MVNGTTAALLELGTGFNPELTGIDNIYFSGTIMGFTKEDIDNKLDAILSFADIGDFVQQPVKTYSSGMFVRLAFALAINVEPDILIVDEAMAVGDISFQAKCYKKFNTFKAQGKTILFVTHALDSIIRYCVRAIVLENGRKICDSSPREAVDVYKKMMVGCYDNDNQKDLNTSLEETIEDDCTVEANGKDSFRQNHFATRKCKEFYSINPGAVIYGDKRAEIIDYGIFDRYSNPSLKLIHGDKFSIIMKVKFNERIQNPIYAYTIKDIKGFEITGTNTQYKRINTEIVDKDKIIYVEFSQILNLQSGQYALSLGCTNNEDDQFSVYHRLYDILLFEVISGEQFVGFYDLGSEISVEVLKS